MIRCKPPTPDHHSVYTDGVASLGGRLSKLTPVGVTVVGAVIAAALGVHQSDATSGSHAFPVLAKTVVSEVTSSIPAAKVLATQGRYDGCCGYVLPRQFGERRSSPDVFLLADPGAKPTIGWQVALAHPGPNLIGGPAALHPAVAELREYLDLAYKHVRPTLVWLYIWHNTSAAPSFGAPLQGCDVYFAVKASNGAGVFDAQTCGTGDIHDFDIYGGMPTSGSGSS